MPLNVGQLQATMDLDISKFTKGMNSAKDQLRGIGVKVADNVEATEQYGDSMDDAGKSANTMASGIKTGTDAVRKNKTEVDAAKKKNEEWKAGIDGVKKAWGYLKTALGAMGLTVGISAVISKLKEFIEDCNEAKKAYNDFVQGTQAATASASVSAQIEELAVATAKAQTQGNKKFTYEDYADAMVVLSQKYPDLLKNEEKMSEMADTYLRFAEVAKTDVASAIKDADEVMKKFNVDVDDQESLLNKFYQISAKTGVELSDMISLLGEGDKAFQLMGYSAEEAAAYIAAVYQKSGDLGDVSTLISNLDKLTKGQYSTFGTEEQQASFIQRVMEETAGMTDETAVLNAIDNIYREMFPTMELDAETGEETNTNVAEIASTMVAFSKLTEITGTNVEGILESTTELDNLSDIAATSEQQTEYLESINGLLEKQFATVDQNLETALTDIKYEANANGENLVSYMNDTANESVDYFWRQRAAKYATYADYVMENARSSHMLFNDETSWQANKNTILNINVDAKAADLIEVNTESNLNAVNSTNNPVRA